MDVRLFIFKTIVVIFGFSWVAICNGVEVRFYDDAFWKLSGPGQYFEDKDGAVTEADILTKSFKSRGAIEAANYSNSTFWMKIRISAKNPVEAVIFTPVPTFSEFRVFRSTSEGLYPAESIHERYSARRVSLPQGETELIIKMKTYMPLLFQVDIAKQQTFQRYILKESILISIAVGAMVALIGYNLFLYLSLRDKLYLFYLLFVTVNLMRNLQAADFPRVLTQYQVSIFWPLGH